MKKVFILIPVLFLIFFTGCCSNLPNLTLSKVEWYTTTEKYNDLTFGFVHLKVSGLTDGDKVTVITAYKGCRYIKVNLKSEELTYLK